MMRSLFSGVAGLKAHQTQMDVIGNNISNVNTYGYKASRTTFRDVYYQTISPSANASGTMGGKNAKQIGYGSAVGSIDVLNTRSGYGSTGRSMDCYIDGEGYFVVRDGAGNERLTQVGTLDFDSDGNLIDGGGNFVCGYTVKGTTEKASVGGATIDFGEANQTLLDGYTIEVKLGSAGTAPTVAANSTSKSITVTLPSDAPTTANLQSALRQLSTASNWTGAMPAGLDSSKITTVSQNAVLQDTALAAIVDVTPAASRTYQTKATVGNAIFDFGPNNSNLLDGYNVEIKYGAAGSTPTFAGDSNNKTITLTIPSDDESLTSLQNALAGIATPANWGSTTMPTGLTATNVSVSDPDATIDDVSGVAAAARTDTPVLATRATVGGAVVDFGTANGNLLNGYSVQVTYGASGSTPKLAANSNNKTITITLPSDAPTAENLQTALNGIATPGNWTGTAPTNLTATGVVGAGKVEATTGKAAEAAIFDYSAPTKITNKLKLTGIGIGPDGSITGEDESGKIVTIGQLAIADVPNPSALTEDGNSYFKVVNNTGEITYHAPGTGNVGALQTGGLEMSNVDLATEFSNMIIAQRGFQANSKIITVADSMLEELVNLKR